MADPRESWLQLAPAAPVMTADHDWTVFVSHASVNDIWLVNLCDALRHGGHTLFLDRWTRTGPERSAALNRSQAGLLVWPPPDQDAAPMRQMLDAMIEHASRQPFRIVIARTNATTLPDFDPSIAVVECSLQPDGPSGGEALRLLLALAGQPIGAAAETFAQEQDAAARAFMAQVKAPGASVESLQQLLAPGGPWEVSSALCCAVAERLVKLDKCDEALPVLDMVTQRFPHAYRPRQVRALALARRGKPSDLGEAEHTLATLYQSGERDPETMGIYARTFMDDYNATGNAASLRRSRDLYAEAYELYPDSYYNGINAAAKSVFLQTEEDLKRGRDYAKRLQAIIGTQEVPDDYWKTATVAEVHLILGDYASAATVYEQAVNQSPNDKGSLTTTWKQASKLMAVLRVDPAARERIRAAFKNPPISPLLDVSQEIRFAIVMYGGVSLAIYINGVAQEFLSMVRATAADPTDRNRPRLSHDDLEATEHVYREAAQMLGRELDDVKRPVTPDDPIRARFVVDILSGTSAGGINAMFLAKALANNQSITELKQLWVEEGAIERLINDGKSVDKLDGLPAENPPTSLLNGHRMYRKLLDAFDGMDRAQEDAKDRSPLVDELDLFVTTTDIRGLPVNLRLADDVVEEFRHRNVFRFRYSDGFTTDAANDFVAETNPFLAYAARCTSSFPFAFAPMKLTDIDRVLAHTPGRKGQVGLGKDEDKWRQFFPAYTPPASDLMHDPAEYDFTDRAFGDGGYLDNKPFGHATEALRSRRGGAATQRKLVFIEPSPEHLNVTRRPGDRPNLFENVNAALSLARYETIRDDLDRVRGRNRLVERIGHIVRGMEYDVLVGHTAKPELRPDFGTLDLAYMIGRYGIAYGGYHRLKVANLTDDLATVLSRIVEYDDRSDEWLAIRYLVRAWRESRFVPYATQKNEAPRCQHMTQGQRRTENEFLAAYDLPYRLRRLEFVIGKIDQLSCIDRITEDLLEQSGGGRIPRTESERAAFRAELAQLRGALRAIYEPLRRRRELLQSRGAANPLAARVKALGIDQTELHKLLKCGSDHERVEFACELLGKPASRLAALDAAAEALANDISPLTYEASERCANLLGIPAASTAAPAPTAGASGSNFFAALAMQRVRHYYEFYERYDLISYPVLQSADVGDELETVDVVRISPEDATSLINERKTNRRKLAGTTLMNFGAFLDHGWRQNDILWGRLDGAERILSTILPPGDERTGLIKRAQLAILEEEFGSSDRDRLCQLLVEGFMAQNSPDASEAGLRALTDKKLGAPINPALQAVLRKSLTSEVLLEFFRESYEVNRNLEPRAALQSLARSSRVVGQLFEQLASEYNAGDASARWLSRIARGFWALVEVAVPGSLGNLIVRHWLKLLYFFELLLILGGTLFGEGGIQRFGVVTFAVTLGVHLALLALGDMMRGRRRWLGITAAIVILPLAVALCVGAYVLVNEPTRSYLWAHILWQLR